MDKLKVVEESIRNTGNNSKVFSVAADATNEQSVKDAFASIRDNLGEVDVLVYNAGGGFKRASIVDLTVADFENNWRASTLGAFLASREVLPNMEKQKSGTIIYTGATASLRGGALLGAFAQSKFSLRAFAQSVAREYQPKGVHVAHVIIDGMVDLESTKKFVNAPEENFISPAAVAETYWSLHSQHPSAWTHELEVRPYVERW
jgi:NAD(P)-dependent dehydrogenase (short-subunit alcohol dehydrogenase family)